MPDRFPTLSILQPYASAIAAGVKPWENRRWAPPAQLIGRVWLLHAGKSRRLLDDPDTMEWVAEHWPQMPMDFPLGQVVGAAVLTAVRDFDPADAGERWDDWACGPMCWRFEPVQKLDPFPLRGMQRVFYVGAADLPPAALQSTEALSHACVHPQK